MKRMSSMPGAVLVGLAILCGPSVAFAQFAPALGVVDQFTVLGGSGVTGSAGAGTLVTGDVGSFPTCNVTNFPPSTVFPPFILHGPVVCDGTVATARADATTAFNDLGAPQGAGVLIADDLSGQVLLSGVYNLGAALLPAGATLTFSGPGVFVLRTASTLTTVATSNVALAGGANSCNIFWQVGSSATLDSNTFRGQVFASASVTVTGNMVGRAIAGSGAVTMPVGGNTIGGCATAAAVPPVIPPVPALPDVATLALLAILLAGGVVAFGRR